MDTPPPASHGSLPKLLVLEFWGLGDLTFSTPLLQAARGKYQITLVGKQHAAALLQPTFPEVRYLSYDAPWSAYRGKYALWRWNWNELLSLLGRLRRERFDAAVSVRNDPRDHLFLWLTGAATRFGFPLKGSEAFLTHPLSRNTPRQHKVEDWRTVGRALGLPDVEKKEPHLDHTRYHAGSIDARLEHPGKPVLALHPGARIAVRRWPENYFRRLVEKLRATFDFHLVLVPDPDGYGNDLIPFADTVLHPLSVGELVDILGRCDVLLCNDSGPGHLAAACGRPTIPIFGPTDPDWFRPWGADHHVVIRDICPWRPCFDYCKFHEPYCLTKLSPEAVWPEIREHLETLIDRQVLPAFMRRDQLAPA